MNLTSSGYLRGITGYALISLLLLFNMFQFYHCSSELFASEAHSLRANINTTLDETLHNITAEDRTDFMKVMENMCAFYDAIKEYNSITAHITNNTIKAIKLVMNETYNDSCNWLRFKIGEDYECSRMDSENVTELCLYVQASNIAEDLVSELEELQSIN